MMKKEIYWISIRLKALINGFHFNNGPYSKYDSKVTIYILANIALNQVREWMIQ